MQSQQGISEPSALQVGHPPAQHGGHARPRLAGSHSFGSLAAGETGKDSPQYLLHNPGRPLIEHMPMRAAAGMSTFLQHRPATVRAFQTGDPGPRSVKAFSTTRRSADRLSVVGKRAFLGLLAGGATMWLSARGLSASAAAQTAEQVLSQFVDAVDFVTDVAKLALVLGYWLLSRGPPVGPAAIQQVLQEAKWPDKFPFGPDAFERYDESTDTIFYDQPRFVTHIDDGAIKALTKFYAESFPASGGKDVALLDICSSWISHYPEGYTAGRVAGLGMNVQELKRNKVLTEFATRDLNKDPRLPYEDDSFDVVTNAVSVDYLTKPLEVFREVNRVLKPGGLAIMSFSNRCFPTKGFSEGQAGTAPAAISIWTQTGDLDHVLIVGSYFHYAGGYTKPEARDISPSPGFFGGRGDPMYVVYARKQA